MEHEEDSSPLYFPASQGVQPLFSKFGYVPAVQEVQVEEPSWLKKPGEHGAHTKEVEAAMIAEDVPAGQPSQGTVPEVAEK